MKRLMATILALLLATGTGTAIADKDRHGGRHGGHDKHHGGHSKHHGGYDKHRSGYSHAYRDGYKDGYRNGYWRAGRWYPSPYPRAVYYSRSDYDRAVYYPLGAALIGSAITYSLFHTHGTTRCYENHTTSYSAPAPEVVGCHRIERYADGSERRVDVPLSECY